MKIRKGDQVKIITGKDKGKKGKVLRVLRRENKIVVEGINIKKKHQKPRRSDQKGQILELAYPIDASNAMVLDPKTGKPTRVGKKLVKGKYVRVSKTSGAVLS